MSKYNLTWKSIVKIFPLNISTFYGYSTKKSSKRILCVALAENFFFPFPLSPDISLFISDCTSLTVFLSQVLDSLTVDSQVLRLCVSLSFLNTSVLSFLLTSFSVSHMPGYFTINEKAGLKLAVVTRAGQDCLTPRIL